MYPQTVNYSFTSPCANWLVLPSAPSPSCTTAMSCPVQVEDEAKAVFNCLAIFENLVEVEPAVGEQVGSKTRKGNGRSAGMGLMGASVMNRHRDTIG